MRTHNMPPYYRKIKETLIMPPDLALLSTLIGSNYPRLELFFMFPKVFELLKFDCIFKCPLIRHPLALWTNFHMDIRGMMAYSNGCVL